MTFVRRGLASGFAVLAVASYAWPQGYPVGPEFRVNTATAGSQTSASVARNASGDFVVVWLSVDSLSSLLGQRYAASGSPVGAEFVVSPAMSVSQRDPRVAADPSGNFVVVWTGNDTDVWDIKARRFSSSGAPFGPEFRVNTFTTGVQTTPSVAMDGAGNFVVVWASSLLDNGAIFGQRYASSGAPIGPQFRVNTTVLWEQKYPSVASNTAGNVVVVWQSFNQDGSGYGIFGQRFGSSGVAAGPEFPVNTATIDDQTTPSVASDAAGAFVVVWLTSTYPSPSGRVFAQRYASSGEPLHAEFEVSAGTDTRNPTVAADAAGDFVVAWTHFDEVPSLGIKAQRYASSGAPLAPEFRVNTFTTGNQRYPSVSVDSAGGFVVVWPGTGSGDSSGIFGQRFSLIVPVELQSFRVD